MYPFLNVMNDPRCYDHEVIHIQLVETHISWVFLTGTYVYKIKKPVNYGFLDFSTLEKRKHYCLRELQYNQELAKDIYLAVVAITPAGISTDLSATDVLEYAVKMRQFDSRSQFDRLQQQGKLTHKHIESLAQKLAEFHLRAQQVKSGPYGEADAVTGPVLENFRQIDPRGLHCARQLRQLESWTLAEFERNRQVFQQRKQLGFIRACHGDVHLRNIALDNDEVIIFDCIEFNEEFRIIDVISEIAFTMMDLQDHGENELAYHLLNNYLQITGDYFGLSVLPFYLVYRSMVRAKVDFLRLQQLQDPGETQAVAEEFGSYLDLATRYTRFHNPVLLISHGLSASGKSYIAQALADKIPAVIMRTDVERKRLLDTGQLDAADPYNPAQREKVYEYIAGQCGRILDSGFAVIVDGTFLKARQRRLFRQLAEDKSVALIILHSCATEATLRKRIVQRRGEKDNVSDADLAVLTQQMQELEPLSESEHSTSYRIDAEVEIDLDEIVDFIVKARK